MSAPLLWIILPGLFAVILLLFSRWFLLNTVLAALVSFILFGAGVLIPVGSEISIGSFIFVVQSSMTILGREILIQQANLPEVTIIYFGMGLWILGGYPIRLARVFPALALGTAALLVAALSVQPFLYAAVFIELAALILIPILVQAGAEVGSGVLRMISFYTIGMSAILFVGWMITETSSVFVVTDIQFRAGFLLALGFMFLLAVFPLHSWVPMIIYQSKPYAAAFFVFWLTYAALFFAHDLIHTYEWIQTNLDLQNILIWAGIFIVVSNGILMMFQRNLGRILGHALLAETGFVLLAASINTITGNELFYSLILRSIFPFILWAFCLSFIHSAYQDISFQSIVGAVKYMRWSILGMIAGQICVLGMPMFSLFPIKLALFQVLALDSQALLIWLMIGIAGALFTTIRVIGVTFQDASASLPEIDEPKWLRWPVIIAIVWMFAGGLLPGLFLSLLVRLIV
jgi:formate hydrogenlyase subunit 3/multisubunit Na+/H+ antiporter MnhD subunit